MNKKLRGVTLNLSSVGPLETFNPNYSGSNKTLYIETLWCDHAYRNICIINWLGHTRNLKASYHFKKNNNVLVDLRLFCIIIKKLWLNISYSLVFKLCFEIWVGHTKKKPLTALIIYASVSNLKMIPSQCGADVCPQYDKLIGTLSVTAIDTALSPSSTTLLASHCWQHCMFELLAFFGSRFPL